MTSHTSNSARSLLLAPLLVLCACLLPLPQQGHIAGLPAFCPWLHLTGLPCPFCGLTRSLVCCAHGHWNAAWHYHLLGPLLFTFLLLTSTRLVIEPVAVRFGFGSVFGRFRLHRKGRVRFAEAIVFLTIVAWTIRLAHWWPLPS